MSQSVPSLLSSDLSADTLGRWARLSGVLLRNLQGLALGGEYVGAAIYVSEHSPPSRRGYFTGYIQGSVVGGFVLSIIVVLLNQAVFPDDVLAAWGWRVPFLLSLALLAISLWMRLRSEERTSELQSLMRTSYAVFCLTKKTHQHS